MRKWTLALLCLGTSLSGQSLLAQAPEAGTAPGIRVQVYEVEEPMDQLLGLAPDQTPNWEQVLPSLDLRKPEDLDGLDAQFRTIATAALKVDTPGDYQFRLKADDGVVLFLDTEPVIIHDGNHPPDPRTAGVRLEPGVHDLRIEHFQGGGGFQLTLEWRPPGQEAFELIDGDHLFVDATLTPVVSPGKKRLQRDAALFRPGDTTALQDVHPAFELVTIRPDTFQPQVGAMSFLPDGRLGVATFSPLNNAIMETEANGTLWAIEGVQEQQAGDDVSNVKVTKAAEGLWDPCGMILTDGRLFVAETEQITELIDEDGDGFYETHRKAAGGWKSDNYHHFTFGIEPDPDDPLVVYIALSVSVILPGQEETRPLDGGPVVGLAGPNPPGRGSVARVDLKSGKVDYIAGGVRTPNGLGFGPDQSLFVTENQGGWMPASKLNQIKPGHFYGYKSDMRAWTHYPDGGSPVPFQDEPFTPPAVWLPQNEISNSPTQPVLIPDNGSFGPYAGQMLVGELTMGGIRRVALEEIDGWYQGALFRFSQGLEAGVNRLLWGPDGALYVGMTGYRGNWAWRDTTHGLQKLVPTGQTPYEMLAISARSDGFEITFTEPADAAYLANVDTYALRTWTYEPGPEYGGKNIDEQTLKVTEAKVAEDGRSVRITVPGLKEGYVVYFRLDPPSQEGKKLWSTEAWYTLNRISKATPTSSR